ncbi:transglutaminase family protein [Brachybacterium hainanense]|uniref:TransglutaminaseTgpA domain-containing protein n=1 Tax=Brachybacterium hainanense TaxID=1541174 RepID=A0ABV6RGL0_9MICO
MSPLRSPLLGRPAPDPATALTRAMILAGATLLAWLPLSLLFSSPQWWFVPLTCTVTVLGVGAVARALLRRHTLVPLVHLLTVLGLTGFAELSTGVLLAQHEVVPAGRGIIAGQIDVLRAGAQEIGGGRAPVDLSGAGTVVLVLAVSLVVVVLDLLFLDLGWHTPTGFALLGLLLVPAPMYPAGGPWWTMLGPLAGGLLIFATRTLHADAAVLIGDERPQAGPLSRRTALSVATLGGIGLVLGGAPLLSAILPRPSTPRIPLDIDAINAWRGVEATDLGPVMIDDSVSVRRDLMRRAETEVLQVRTDAQQPEYLRLHTLTVFDGSSFRRGDTGADADDAGMPESFSDRRGAEDPVPGAARYDVTVTSLRGDALPAPPAIGWYRTGQDVRLVQDRPVDGTLIVPGGARDLTGLAYSVSSRPAPYTAADLRAVPAGDGSLPLETGYVNAEVPGIVADLAAQIAAEAGTRAPYDTALAYVDFFHREFEYSLSVRSRPGEDPIESFLADRIGYCEQYAATFALMMIAQGSAARVVIGFTSGTADPAAGGEDARIVTNHHAHAWPEVWFGAAHGWVRFEPTPASAGSGTARPAHEDEQAPPEAEEQPAPSPSASAPEQAPTTTAPPETGTSSVEPAPTGSTSAEGTGGEGPDADGSGEGTPWTAIGIGAGILGGAGLLAGGAGLRSRILGRRREARWAAVAAGSDPETRERSRRAAGELAWSELAEALEQRHRRRRLLGWAGRWGAPHALALDASLPPGRALDSLLDELAGLGRWEGRGAEGDVVGPEHRAAASRIAAALEASRYAPPVAIGPGAAPRTAVDPDPADPVRVLRRDADLLTGLIRSL